MFFSGMGDGWMEHFARSRKSTKPTTHPLLPTEKKKKMGENKLVKQGSTQRPSLRGRGGAIIGQTNIVTVSKSTLGTILIDGVRTRTC